MKRFRIALLRLALMGLSPLERIHILQSRIGYQRSQMKPDQWRKSLDQLYHQGLSMAIYPLLDAAERVRLIGFYQLMESLQEVPGAVVECGVGMGYTLVHLAALTSLLKQPRQVFGFDSFEGFPAATVEDMGERVNQAGKKVSGWSHNSPELVRQAILELEQSQPSYFAHLSARLHLYQGYFDQNMPQHLPDQIAFLHVDADLYKSTKTVLDHGWSRVSPGGLIVFDEYHDPRWPGVKKAVDEACREHHTEPVYLPEVLRYGIRITAKA
ncbi:MAG: class I SAM-dependent methyltransferase [Anaerolineae bacterium]|nr:class I SAM-dependent methyltransferase [Anaerolineae bacterium]